MKYKFFLAPKKLLIFLVISILIKSTMAANLDEIMTGAQDIFSHPYFFILASVLLASFLVILVLFFIGIFNSLRYIYRKIFIQNKSANILYLIFGIITIFIMGYYLSKGIYHFTGPDSFPVNSFIQYPLSIIIFPAQMFSFLFSLYFVYCLMNAKHKPKPPATLKNKKNVSVAVLIPVYNEPIEVVERTIIACSRLIWPGKVNIYLLDDSTKFDDKKNMIFLSEKYNIKIINRDNRRGYKAGNINNAVAKYIHENYFVILDSDQAPEPEFLEKTIDYFSDNKIAFVQTPQHYVNEKTPLERAAKISMNLFYNIQCPAKQKDSSVPFLGTNVVIKTRLFKNIAGFSYYTSTEDIELGLRFNEADFYGVYVPEVLVNGYSPPDFKAYSCQQYRWANGNLAVLRESFSKIFFGKFTFRQQAHHLFILCWWMIGVVNLIYVMVPIFAFFSRQMTYEAWLPASILFIIFFNLCYGLLLIYVSNNSVTKSDKLSIYDVLLQYSLIMNTSFIYAKAAINSLLFKNYIGFVRTHKKRSDTPMGIIKWNLIFAIVCLSIGIYSGYNAYYAESTVELMAHLPIAIWLTFYGIMLSTSPIFLKTSQINYFKELYIDKRFEKPLEIKLAKSRES
jgi:cellulose synthase (UDP-forming)